MLKYVRVLSAALVCSILFSVNHAAAEDPDPDAAGDNPGLDLNVETGLADGGVESGWWFGVASRVGLDIPTAKLKPFVVAGLDLDVFFPVLDSKLGAAFDFSFTYPRYGETLNQSGVGSAYEYENKVLELKFTLDAIYRFLDNSRSVVPFAGLGVGLQYLKTTQTSTPDFGDNSEKNAAFAFEVFGGVDFMVGPGAIFGDLRFVFSRLDQEITGDTNAGNLTICAGYRFIF